MAIQNFSKSFTGGGILNTVKSFLPIVCGVPESLATTTNPRYTVKIEARDQSQSEPSFQPIHIWGWLQEKFVFRVESMWQPLQSLSGGAGDDLIRIFSGSNASTIGSRRKWVTSSPIALGLKLRFEAMDDVWTEVIEPCKHLQGLCLPSKGTGVIHGERLLLRPPGPNPLYIPGKASRVTIPILNYRPFGAGEVISIDIGMGFIKFNSVILKDVEVEFESRMSASGPIGATAKVTFETYSMITREALDKAYEGSNTGG